METKERQEKVTDALVLLTETCHGLAKEGGWWPEGEERDVGNMLMLIVSEVAEALEGDRKDLMDEHLPHHKMFDVEMADVLIRSFDIIGGLLADTAIAFPEKLLYNINRADHSKEARAAKGGKKY
ncbi:MAG: hypothetical protein COA47_10130 [Robiginitomaculum sp.]|nr:MAG: hypothetical protein COA47_10130 [Robiginitomaculum sp.]